MRRMISVPLILAAAAALSFLPVQDCLAYGPGDSWYYDHYILKYILNYLLTHI